MTAEAFIELPHHERFCELVRGEVAARQLRTPAHGYRCATIGCVLRDHARRHDWGRVVSNGPGVVTARDPDTVRRPDVAYFSFQQVPKGPPPQSYWPAPELVFEVRSPSDRLSAVTAKVAEYLAAGVTLVCVLDPDTESVAVYSEHELPRRVTADDELTLPEVLPDFRVPVRDLLG